ncbi:MAG TPA: nucleoside hydrolase [Balneolales bacterium]|nr:nucleoside hydrolase [Balneolales bacterium]
MKRTYWWCLFLAGLLLLSPVISAAQQSRKPVHVIFDTDIGPDYDDVGAITVLHALADSGQAKILATVASNRYPKIAEVLDVFNTYFGEPNIPIGVPKGPSVELKDWQGWSDAIVAKYPHKITSNNQVPDPVVVYRSVLSNQPDHSVTVVSTGFFTNLANLLESGPDKYSPLNGKELVEQKVKRLVSMAGKFPSGAEFNVDNDIPSSNYVFANWPTEIIFSGFEIGVKIKTGIPLIHNDHIENDPVKDVFSISIPKAAEDKNGRSSWDETAALVAVKGVSPYFKLVPGHISSVDDGGQVHWDTTRTGQYYLRDKKSVAYITGVINALIQHQPVRK